MVMAINFLKYRKIYFVFSGILIIGSFVSLCVFGLNAGIDFTGGSILEIEYKNERPSNQEIKETLSELGLGEIYIQPTEEKGVILRMKDIPEESHREIINKLGEGKELEELRFESVGPVIGKELKEKTKIVVIFSLIAIVLYIAFAFRRLTFPAKSWQYGLASLFALFHDVLIPLGVFSLLGKFYGIQITIPVVVALLTVLGYSINNTVVVFDRIRENLLKGVGVDYMDNVNQSLNQSLTRSINTSLTTLFVLAAIFFLGGETLKYFALALMVGIIAGTYSSLFLVSPILVSWLKWRKKI
jgi:preprotein translocase subunit SecF